MAINKPSEVVEPLDKSQNTEPTAESKEAEAVRAALYKFNRALTFAKLYCEENPKDAHSFAVKLMEKWNESFSPEEKEIIKSSDQYSSDEQRLLYHNLDQRAVRFFIDSDNEFTLITPDSRHYDPYY